MQRSQALETALELAKAFLTPALLANEGGSKYLTATEAIASHRNQGVQLQSRKQVVVEACSWLQTIHDELKSAQTQAKQGPQMALDTGVMAQVFPLLDLILLEGVYPSLSKGIGFPLERQKRSLLCNKSCVSFQDLMVLPEVLLCLNRIVFLAKDGLHRPLQDSVLLDLIVANADLAFAPSREQANRDVATQSFSGYLQDVPTPRLHQVLTVLIGASSPQWFRSNLAHHLSLLPLRPRGVRQTIEFLSSYYAVPLPGSDEPLPVAYQRRLISPEGLAQATKILTSIPSSLTEKEYYTKLAPQLLGLVDGDGGAELSIAVAGIITNGILNKRSTGAPGTIGWELLAAPDIRIFQCSVAVASSANDVAAEILVSQTQLERSLKRLAALVNSTINVSLTGRLLRPILLPLWGLAAFDSQTVVAKTITATASHLVETFLSRCGNVSHVNLIRDNLLWDGEIPWTYGPGEAGGIAIRSRDEKSSESDIIDTVTRTDGRIMKFVDIISNSHMDDEIIGILFRQCLRSLLRVDDGKSEKASNVLLHSEQNPLKHLATVQLVQALLSRFDERLASKPHQILSLIDQMLLETVEKIKESTEGESTRGTSLRDISNIALKSSSKGEKIDAYEFSEDIVATSVSLLNALITVKDFKPDIELSLVLKTTLSYLRFIRNAKSIAISSTTMASIDTSIHLLNSLADNGDIGSTSALQSDAVQISSKLIKSFADDPPPIQASTLHNLLGIVKMQDTPLDIPGLTTIILEQISTNSDTYVHPFLNNALAQLAALRSPGYTTRATVAAFQDADEKSNLNGRLRLGEALSILIEELTKQDSVDGMSAEVSTLMAGVASACLAVAGRRSTRTLEQKERAKAEKKAKIDQQRTERAWGGKIPNLAHEEDDGDQRDEGTRDKGAQENSAIQRIIQGWEGTGKTEDIRVRSTAMSVLATVMERAGPALSADTIGVATDLALAILSFETGEEAFMLRRAAVLLFMAHLRALDLGLEIAIDIPSIDGARWLDVEKALVLASQVDSDDLVRENAAIVVESLQSWRMKQLLGHAGNQIHDFNSLRLKKLQGLSVGPDASQGRRPKIDVLD